LLGVALGWINDAGDELLRKIRARAAQVSSGWAAVSAPPDGSPSPPAPAMA